MFTCPSSDTTPSASRPPRDARRASQPYARARLPSDPTPSNVDRLRRCTRRPCTAASYIAAHPRPARGVRQSETGTRIRVIFAAGLVTVSATSHVTLPVPGTRDEVRRVPVFGRVGRDVATCAPIAASPAVLAWTRGAVHRRAVSSPATCATHRRTYSEYRGRSAPTIRGPPASLPARRPGRDRTCRPSAGASGSPTSARRPRRAATSPRVPRSPRR